MNANATIIEIVLSAIFINNFIFSQFLGCCPFLGCSSKVDTAAGMGLAVIFVMGLTSAICWIMNTYILMPLGLGFLQTIAYILVIAVLVQLLGMCATMAITTSLFNGIGMGFSVLAILTCCNVVISLIRKIIPNDIRLAIFVLVIAGFVTIVDLLLQAFIPALSESLGVFIPLIVVNCIIIGRAEAFCQKNPVGASFFDGIFQGLGYTCVLICMCVIREFLGKGSFGSGIFNTTNGIGTGTGIHIFPSEYGALVLTLPIGGFITLGCLIALMQYVLKKNAKKKEAKEKEGADV